MDSAVPKVCACYAGRLMGSRLPSGRGAGSLWRTELARGVGLQAAGDLEGARAAFARAHDLAPGEPEPALALGRQEERRGRPSEAERLYRLALEARPPLQLA